MLSIIDETPVDTVDLTHPDVNTAIDIWDRESATFQNKGWWYNSEEYQLVIDVSTSEVFVPKDALTVRGANLDYIKRGVRLYDKGLHTFTFDDPDVLETDLLMICNILWGIEELPTIVYAFLIARSKMTMLNEKDPDPAKMQQVQRDIDYNLHLINNEHLRFSNPNRKAAPQSALWLSQMPYNSRGTYRG